MTEHLIQLNPQSRARASLRGARGLTENVDLNGRHIIAGCYNSMYHTAHTAHPEHAGDRVSATPQSSQDGFLCRFLFSSVVDASGGGPRRAGPGQPSQRLHVILQGGVALINTLPPPWLHVRASLPPRQILRADTGPSFPSAATFWDISITGQRRAAAAWATLSLRRSGAGTRGTMSRTLETRYLIITH